MATDPTPYLSTMTGASAGLVAIVGGLLVARYVGLDSAQQGADQVLTDAQDRLKTAQDRATTAANKLLQFEAIDFLGDSRVLNEIQAGTRDLARLRVRGTFTALSDDELQPFIDDLVEEFANARPVLDAMIPPLHEAGDRREIYLKWNLFHVSHASELPHGLNEQVWMRVCEDVRRDRLEADAKWRKQHPPKGAFGNLLDIRGAVGDRDLSFLAVSPASTRASTDFVVIKARRRDNLRSERDRTQQQLEDIEGEVRRLEQARAAIVKPDKLLWQGFLILVVFSGVGIIAPLWAMSRTLKDLTPHLSWLFYGFAIMLTILIAYFAGHAWRLTRGKRRRGRRRPDPSGTQVTK